MKTSRHDAALVEGIYDAAIEPVLWPEVLTRLADDLGCDGLHLLTFNLCGNQPTFGAVGRIDPAAEAEYARDYLYVDFRVPRLLNQPSMQAFLDSGITTEHERNTSPFHNEFLVKYDCRALLCANFALEPNYKGFIAAGRGSKRREFDEPTRTRLGLYLRTLCQGLRIHTELQRSRDHATSLEHLMDQCKCSVLLLDTRGVLQYANAEGLRLLHKGGLFKLQQGRIVPALAGSAAHFERALALARAAGGASMVDERAYYFQASPTNGLAPLQVMVRPLKHTQFRLFGNTRTDIAVYVSDFSSNPLTGDLTTLRDMYGFTSAEARCAVLLRDGASLHEIADELKLSLATIRSHLSHMLHKCGVSRQGALIARLRQDLWLFAPRGD